jgi:hypothetical protein
MADFNSTIIGLQNTISNIIDVDTVLRNQVQKFTNTPFPDQVSSTSVKNRKSIIWQIQGLPSNLSLADLMMSINPRNLNISYSQLINRKRTHGGFIEEHWGEQLDELSASGTTRQFYGATGLTNLNRRDSTGWMEYDKLLTYYRNNGSIYDDKTSKIVAQGTVVMNYDSAIFNGYFEKLSIVESADKPYCLDYDFSFKVTAEVFPGRIQSFANITTIPTVDAVQNDNVSIDITTTTGRTTASSIGTTSTVSNNSRFDIGITP